MKVVVLSMVFFVCNAWSYVWRPDDEVSLSNFATSMLIWFFGSILAFYSFSSTSARKELSYDVRTLELMAMLGVQRSNPRCPSPLHVFDMEVPFRGRYRVALIFFIFSCIAVPTTLWLFNFVYSALFLLTLYSFYNMWKMGFQIAIYSVVACRRITTYQGTDFKALHSAQQRLETSASSCCPKWDDILHFLLLPNYKEDIEVLRLAVESVAKSSIAATQICLVLAMEAREDAAEEKACHLKNLFQGRFKHIFVTYHPEGLPGEIPGKSANTRWAANQVFDSLMSKCKAEAEHVVLTVADADSEFYPEYFSALTYHFINAGAGEHQTPERHLTIWQAPVLHYKNYISQPPLVKFCSLMTSLHELSCLGQRDATRIAYSTYSISATLALAVKGWDPDWISEDWHMAMKTFLATGGRLRITPIYMPILNYAPEGDSSIETYRARWAQGKRHALGFAELVYFLDHFWRIVGCIKDRQQQVIFVWKSFFFWFHNLMTHLVMSTYLFLAPLNAYIIIWLIRHRRWEDITSNAEYFILVANLFSQAITCVYTIGLFVANTRVFECIKDRIEGTDDPDLKLRWRSPCFNTLVTSLQTGLVLPLFFLMAASCEWIAIAKTVKTHRFDYEVALKPNLSKMNALPSKNKDSVSESTSGGGDSGSQSEPPSEESENEVIITA